MNPRNYRWLLLSLGIVGFFGDIASKYGVFRSLYDGTLVGNRELIPGVFRLHVDYLPAEEGSCDCTFVKWNGPIPPRVNHGALFGLGGEHKRLANGFFAIVSILAALGIVFWGTRAGPSRDPLLSVALGLILAGTLGNFYDRIVFGGVRDFLYFYLIEWPVFNIADCCLVCGAGLLLFHALFMQPKAMATPVVESQPPSATDEGYRSPSDT